MIGYRRGAEKYAWVHWREGRILALWEGGADPRSAETAPVASRRQLDLNLDVAATEAEIAGSTYRVSQAWLDQTLADCQAHGWQYAVLAPPRRDESGE